MTVVEATKSRNPSSVTRCRLLVFELSEDRGGPGHRALVPAVHQPDDSLEESPRRTFMALSGFPSIVLNSLFAVDGGFHRDAFSRASSHGRRQSGIATCSMA